MFAVFGVNYKAIQLKEHQKGGSLEDIEKRISRAFKRKTKLKVSPIYSDPNTCKAAIKLLAGNNDFSNLEIRFHLHREVTTKTGKKRISKSWVRYQGESDLLDLLANLRKK